MDKNAPEIKRMFRSAGFDLRTDPTSIGGTENDTGRSDGVVLLGRKFVYVEFKNHDDGLSTGKASYSWRAEQRAWAAEKASNGSEYFLALISGENRPDAIKASLKPKRAWLIPYIVAERAVWLVEQASKQKLVPYRAEVGRGKSRALFEKKLDCITLFRDFELLRFNGEWFIPESHIFWKCWD